jgi:UDP-glucose 4-epimerase
LKKNILITGGLGYIGCNLAKYLSDFEHFNVVLSSRKLNTIPPEISNCSFIELSLENSESEIINKLINIHIVIHLAALNERESLNSTENAINVNILGVYKLLNSSIKAGVEKFIYFSTAHIYGSPLIGNLSEETCPHPINPYAITHKAAEDFIISAHRNKEIDGIVFRLSNAIGSPIHYSNSKWTLLVNDLCKQIVEFGKIELKSSGEQYRNFISMNDVCRAVTHFIKSSLQNENFPVYNLGGEKTISVIEMTKMVAEVCKKNYGFLPEITRKLVPNETVNKFEFVTSKLLKYNFYCDNDYNKEIENTLNIAFNELGKF